MRQNNLHKLTTNRSTLIMWRKRFSKNENEAVEAQIPRHRLKNQDIIIKDQKATVSSFSTILTLIPLKFSRFYVPCFTIPSNKSVL